MPVWEPVIGLEVHVHLKTRSKIFCRCENRFGADPNTLVCPVCLGYPGTLPVLNARAVELAATLALALGCEVAERSVFARKNYFYADLPKGYQISQFDRPLAMRGLLPLADSPRAIRVHRLHLEEDAGKLLHEWPGGGPTDGVSLVDFNRCGVPLVEIVSEPEIASAAEAEDYLRSLHQVLLFTGASDGNLEEGSLRCDANVSLRRPGEERLGTKVEVKNLNSFKHVAHAVDYEILRQAAVLDAGGTIPQETRSFDAESGRTRTLRGKEAAHDYRYFPDPDLPLLQLAAERLAELAAALPEMPWKRRTRLVEELGLPATDARDLVAQRELADYFEAVVAAAPALPRAAANWVRNDVARELKERQATIESAIAPQRLAEVLLLVENGEVSSGAARELLREIWTTDESAAAAMARLGLAQVRDETQLVAWVQEVLEKSPSQVAQVREGRTQVLGFLVGQVMKRSAGRAEPRRVQELVKAALGVEEDPAS
ncbi:MAG: Asp-tRNA(Asn)/Glu-tRNA(Gln) amidotransferase subunit GatB [Thermoanaerobaculia bacterium]|nr:Asp-tRNA(Asn)/Glu-tRNA(Gln) amidotransferase subunit GatB [Thermoanaerobaculia bacterium]